MEKFYSDQMPLFQCAKRISKTVHLLEDSFGKLIPALSFPLSPESFYWGCILNYHGEGVGGGECK